MPSCEQNNRLPADATGVPHCGECKTVLPWLISAIDDDFDPIAIHVTLAALVDLWAP